MVATAPQIREINIPEDACLTDEQADKLAGRIGRVCGACGKHFYVVPSVLARGSGKFCSRKCFHISRKFDKVRHADVLSKRVERTCGTCGKHFHVVPSAAAKGGGNFCSPDCFHISRRLDVRKHCELCGKEFFVAPSRLARGNGRFCSKSCAGRERYGPSIQRFYEAITVDDNGCWIFGGDVGAQGYGHIQDAGVLRTTHTYSYELYHGAIPQGHMVLHKCPGGGNKACVNPAHLKAGTAKENSEDMMRSGRGRGQFAKGIVPWNKR